MFWSKKRLNSTEFETLTKRIIVIEANIERVRNLVDNLRTNLYSLRGIFNRKIGGGDIEPDSNEVVGIDDGFNDLRKLNKDKKS